MVTRCHEVLIKFMDKNLPQQEIRALQVSGASILEVSRDSQYLTLMHKSTSGLNLKELNFNLSDVKEYVCEGIENTYYVESDTLTPGVSETYGIYGPRRKDNK